MDLSRVELESPASQAGIMPLYYRPECKKIL